MLNESNVNHNSLVSIGMSKTNKLKGKTLFGQVQGWNVLIYIYIYISQIYTNI